jgi:Rha family phage regulatory protein
MEIRKMTEGIDATRTPIVRLTQDNEAMADSRDVAAYFGKNHFDVLKTIRNLSCSDNFRQRNFASFKIKDLTGESTSHVTMTKDGFTFLAMGFTGGRAAAYKERYIAAFNVMEAELRSRPSGFDVNKVLNDPAAMRGLLLTYTEKVLALEEKVEDLNVSAAALDRIATADGSLCITDAAKALQMQPKTLFGYLRAHGWIYRRTGGLHDLGYQSKVAAGLLEHKVTTVTKADGSEKITEQVRITPKGLAALAKLFPQSVSSAA